MEFNLPVTAGALVGLVALGTVGLIMMPAMQTRTVLMMVAPSMLVFGAICLVLGIKHGEYRASSTR
ncbi:hypothetical protein GL213_11595 [Halogeometricum borinquense]|uniref:Uncharacterized protein n=2 Tax=Halogeometricum borinquense TaxID=60847 RepID=E4NQV1_HALBP|nr:hypothetical protein [Halogeometricum borinquense]ADQ67898.1 hypothetical protein Hbor_23380 [Halogeometricum borinquense DSM 11551]ELY24182.1 hypothetical protein C499_16752 [Halogeometricum borinquense DSM 11551]QIB73491.1 hypothetical protein G3I44_03855 [Halogeometricum borinquense]QIQ77111.1 hypothetical protein GL213_11595 [Halogeometricum borinquense]RYJ13201.1 hypothetical protein ELS19_03920 [Halogeometricum borinquense]